MLYYAESFNKCILRVHACPSVFICVCVSRCLECAMLAGGGLMDPICDDYTLDFCALDLCASGVCSLVKL